MSGAGEKRNVVLGVTGSIAAYKAVELARLLVSRGYNVRTVMTKSACEFVTPLTFSSITGHPVVTDFWKETSPSEIGHIELADWANVFVVAPATAEIISGMAAGRADTPLLATLLVTRTPILIAPAMNVNMYEHPATQENVEVLKLRGVHFIGPEEGELACGKFGKGRLSDPWDIFHHVRRLASPGDYRGKRVLISAGPTREAIDPVRFLSNRSSGKMGVALALEAFCRGADVTLVHGPVPVKVPSAIECVPVTTALEMEETMTRLAFEAPQAPDIVIMTAAVSDFRLKNVSAEKLKRQEGIPSLELVANPDVLRELGTRRANGQHPLLIGFAVETGEIDELLNEAREKLKRKSADLIVGNFAEEAFDLDTNRAWIIDRTGRQEEIATTFKSRVSDRILDAILRIW